MDLMNNDNRVINKNYVCINYKEQVYSTINQACSFMHAKGRKEI